MKRLIIPILALSSCAIPATPDKPGLVTSTCNCVTVINDVVTGTAKVKHGSTVRIEVSDTSHIRVFNRDNVMVWDTVGKGVLVYKLK